jgi:DNA repair exonuclease SbcCD ATPase subunit
MKLATYVIFKCHLSYSIFMLKLETIHIENFTNISNATIDFNSPVILFVGENASGKSSVLDAIAICLSEHKRSDTFKDYVTYGEKAAKILLNASINNEPISFDVTINNSDTGSALERVVKYNKKEYHNSEVSQLLDELELTYFSDLLFSMQGEDDITKLTPTQRANYLRKLLAFDFSDQIKKIDEKTEETEKLIEHNKTIIELKTNDIASKESSKQELEKLPFDEAEFLSYKKELENINALKDAYNKQIQLNSSLKEQISKIDIDIIKLQNSIKQNEDKVAQLKALIEKQDSLKSEKEDNEKEIEKLEKEHSYLLSSKEEQLGKKSELESAISSINLDIQNIQDKERERLQKEVEVKDKISHNSLSINDLNSKISSILEEIDRSNEKINNSNIVKKEVDVLEKELLALKDSLSKDEKEYKLKGDEKKDKEDKFAKISISLAKATTSLDVINNRIEQISNGICPLCNGKVTKEHTEEIKKEKSKIENDIKNLNSEKDDTIAIIDKLEKEYGDLYNKLLSERNSVSSSESTIKEKKQALIDIDEINKTIGDANKKIETMKISISEIEKENKELESSLVVSKDETSISDLQSALHQKENDMKEITSKIEDVTSSISNCCSSISSYTSTVSRLKREIMTDSNIENNKKNQETLLDENNSNEKKIEEYKSNISLLEKQIVDIVEPNKDKEIDLLGKVESYNKVLADNNALIKLNEDRKAQIENDKKEIETINSSLVDLNNSIDLYKNAKVIFDKKLPNYLIIKTCTRLQTAINDFIQGIFPDMEVQLFHSKKGVEFFYTTNRSQFTEKELSKENMMNIKMASGFEKAALSMAFKTALCEAYNLPFCILDEVDSAASDENSERLFESVVCGGFFKQCIIISHKPIVRDTIKQMAIDEKSYSVVNGTFTLE